MAKVTEPYATIKDLFRTAEWHPLREPIDSVNRSDNERRVKQLASAVEVPEGQLKDCSEYKHRATRNAQLYVGLQEEIQRLIDASEDSKHCRYCGRYNHHGLIDELRNLLRLRKD